MEILQTSGDKVLLPCEGNSDVVVEGEEKSEQMNITEQPQFMWNGISLTYLQDFLLLCDPNGREGIVDLTTGDIVEKFIKPATVVSQKSYCDMLLEQPEDCATFDVISPTNEDGEVLDNERDKKVIPVNLSLGTEKELDMTHLSRSWLELLFTDLVQLQ